MGLRKCEVKHQAEISTPSILVTLIISVYAMVELHMPLGVTWVRSCGGLDPESRGRLEDGAQRRASLWLENIISLTLSLSLSNHKGTVGETS